MSIAGRMVFKYSSFDAGCCTADYVLVMLIYVVCFSTIKLWTFHHTEVVVCLLGKETDGRWGGKVTAQYHLSPSQVSFTKLKRAMLLVSNLQYYFCNL